MTKVENRAAAREWHRQRQKELRDEMHRAAVAADLAELGRLRRYLIFQAQAGVSTARLIDAIDHHAEGVVAQPRQGFRVLHQGRSRRQGRRMPLCSRL